jgi:Flp pilus assembly protein TadD
LRGDYTHAIAELEKALELSGGGSEPLMQLGYAYAASGDRAKAEEQIERLRGFAPARYAPVYNIAMIYHGLGEKEAALQKLEESLRAREASITFILVDRRWDSLRDDPSFRRIIENMKLNK